MLLNKGTVTTPKKNVASSLTKGVYNPKAVIPHAASLHQACAHCAIFPTAASRRSLDRFSVPVWPVTLSGRLPVEALVSRYLTNQLIGHELYLPRIATFNLSDYGVLGSVSERYPPRQDRFSCFTHPSATPYTTPCYHFMAPSFNLHVLRTPPAFILSQDQTLSNSLSCLYLHAVFFCQVIASTASRAAECSIARSD